MCPHLVLSEEEKKVGGQSARRRHTGTRGQGGKRTKRPEEGGSGSRGKGDRMKDDSGTGLQEDRRTWGQEDKVSGSIQRIAGQ
jgi:hypothetical protein